MALRIFFRNYLSIIALPFLFFIYIPLDIYIYNSNDFNANFWEVIAVSLSSFFIAAVFLTVIQKVLKRNGNDMFSLSLSVGTIFFWVVSTFLYGDYGVLSGEPLKFVLSSNLVIWDFSVLFLLFLFAFLKKTRSIIKYLLAICLLSILMNLVSLVIGSDSSIFQKRKVVSSFHDGLTDFSVKKNVIHILLDEFQGNVFEDILNARPDLKKQFEGFQLYTDTSAVFPLTEMSLPLLETGEIYKNDQPITLFMAKHRERASGVRNLAKVEFRLDALSKCRYSTINNCTDDSLSLVSESSSLWLDYIKLLDISLFKIAPELLKPFVYNKGDWILSSLLSNNTYLQASWVGPAHLIFNKFVHEMDVLPNMQPTYKFIYSAVSHQPKILDRDCNVVEESSSFEFNQCAIKHVVEFLEKIKSLGVYEQSMIIISSDHGRGELPIKVSSDFSNAGLSPWMVGRATALLLIKPYNAKGPMQKSKVQASLADVAKTIIVNNGIDASVSGRDLFSADSKDIPREFFNHNYSPIHKNGRMDSFERYPIYGPVLKPSSWTNINLERLEPLNCNQILEFKSNINSYLYSEGLSGMEPWGRWSYAKVVRFKFKFLADNCSHKISFTLNAFVTDKNKRQHAKILLNNTQIGDVVIKMDEQRPKEFVLSISPELVKVGDLNVLEFHIDNPVSPKSVGVGDDERLLGLRFISMVLQ